MLSSHSFDAVKELGGWGRAPWPAGTPPPPQSLRGRAGAAGCAPWHCARARATSQPPQGAGSALQGLGQEPPRRATVAPTTAVAVTAAAVPAQEEARFESAEGEAGRGQGLPPSAAAGHEPAAPHAQAAATLASLDLSALLTGTLGSGDASRLSLGSVGGSLGGSGASLLASTDADGGPGPGPHAFPLLAVVGLAHIKHALLLGAVDTGEAARALAACDAAVMAVLARRLPATRSLRLTLAHVSSRLPLPLQAWVASSSLEAMGRPNQVRTMVCPAAALPLDWDPPSVS